MLYASLKLYSKTTFAMHISNLYHTAYEFRAYQGELVSHGA